MAKSRPKPPGKKHPVMVIALNQRPGFGRRGIGYDHMVGHAKPAPRKGAKGSKRK